MTLANATPETWRDGDNMTRHTMRQTQGTVWPENSQGVKGLLVRCKILKVTFKKFPHVGIDQFGGQMARIG